MKALGKYRKSIWQDEDNPDAVFIIDQRRLPHEFIVAELSSWEDAEIAIREMLVRGAPLIGVTAAWGLYLASITAEKNGTGISYLETVAEQLKEARPTAVNLSWAVNKLMQAIRNKKESSLKETAWNIARQITQEDEECCRKIGEQGLPLIQKIYERTQKPVQIMTHCNAGWLACVDHGTATSPIYLAHNLGIPIHVWVSETRPRLQGALTAWEMVQQEIAHTVIVDNSAGHLLQNGKVDLVITGADRIAANGDTANKIGTYLKALAAKANKVPFYVALPTSSFDLKIKNGDGIPIETRGQNEVKEITGLSENDMRSVEIFPQASSAANFGFDITPSTLITGLITEMGICEANEKSISALMSSGSK